MRLENIAFWILIALTIAVAFWMLHGSPTESGAIIAVALFVASSEILIWKTIFEKDKKTAVSFEKMKNQLENIQKDIKSLLNKNDKRKN